MEQQTEFQGFATPAAEAQTVDPDGRIRIKMDPVESKSNQSSDMSAIFRTAPEDEFDADAEHEKYEIAENLRSIGVEPFPSINVGPGIELTADDLGVEPGDMQASTDMSTVPGDVLQAGFVGLNKASNEAMQTAALAFGLPQELAKNVINLGLDAVGMEPIKNAFGDIESMQSMVTAYSDAVNTLVPVPDAVQEWANQPYDNEFLGALTEGIVQFTAVGFPAAKVVKAMTNANPVMRGLMWGAIADFTAFDPDDPTIIQGITDYLIDAPAEERGPVLQILMAQIEKYEDEPELVKRAKTALEGAIIGVAVEGVFLIVKTAIKQAQKIPFRQIIDNAGQAADARIARRAANTGVTLTAGVDPTPMVDAALSGAGKVARGAKRQVVTPGTTIPPKTSPATTDDLAAAQADTRQTAESVGQRLDITVPEAERVAGGTYVAGAPGGGRWTDLPEETLSKRGPGFAGSDADLERMWQETLSEVSQAARDSVSRTGATWRAFPAKSWDLAMRLPNRHQFWYELSGESFVDRLPDLNMDEHMMFVDLVGATSARAGPGPNLERAVAVLSQNLRGVPVDVDLTTQSTVEAALQRQGVGVSSDLANKTGMFSDTLALTGGLPVRYPIAVNDVWVAKAYGITDNQLSGNQALHEVFGKYTNKLRDFTNQKSPGGIPHQSWQKQARQWVQMRSADDGIDTSQVTSVEGNDYASEFGRLVQKLEGAGINVPGGVLTRNILMDPRVADALRPTTPGYREAPKATVEFGTLLTPSGEKGASIFAAARDAGDTLTQQEYLGTLTGSMYTSARGKTLWEKTVRLATNESRMVTRISAPTKADPFAYSGTFEGAAAPNIRIPLKNMSPDQIAYFNAMAGKGLKQKAMAAAEIKNITRNEALPEGYIETNTLYFP